MSPSPEHISFPNYFIWNNIHHCTVELSCEYHFQALRFNRNGFELFIPGGKRALENLM